ncbi:TspO/MBR family protein [Gallaecimonas sp. GXIMD1310]|uniref:TspO/MBR family protein n=1 Tax=Gallaecimonas sp. GXIMD1310 TaxID=3131926 RepID=UPI003252D307
MMRWVGAFLLVAAVAATGVLFPPGAWYQGLLKPAFNPPNWLFAPVWTLLYIFMAVVLARRWPSPDRQWRLPFFLQLAANAAWTPLFFGAHLMALALADIAFLFAAIFWLLRVLHPTDRLSFWLMLPYALWVGFALLLNATLLWLNSA